jgi:hypothetical protein
MISISGVVSIIVKILVCGVIYYLLNLLIDKAPYVNENFKVVARYILIFLCILAAIGLLLQFLGIGGFGDGPLFRQ